MNQMRRNQFINLAVWLGLLSVIALCVAIIYFGPKMQGTNYKATKGTVANKFPDNHLGICYYYNVNGHIYEGVGYIAQSKQVFDAIHVGDGVVVFYNSQRPDSSTLENPNVLIVRSVGQIIAVSLICSVLGMCALHRYQLIPECETFKKCRS